MKLATELVLGRHYIRIVEDFDIYCPFKFKRHKPAGLRWLNRQIEYGQIFEITEDEYIISTLN